MESLGSCPEADGGVASSGGVAAFIVFFPLFFTTIPLPSSAERSREFRTAGDGNEVDIRRPAGKTGLVGNPTQIISHPVFVLQAALNSHESARKECESSGRMPAANANGHHAHAEKPRSTRRYLCEVRAGQYWRVEALKSFDEFLERRFPESRADQSSTTFAVQTLGAPVPGSGRQTIHTSP